MNPAMQRTSDYIYKAVILATTIAACWWVYVTAPSVYISDGRSGVALTILIATSVVAMIALFGFLSLEVLSELEPDKKRNNPSFGTTNSEALSKKDA